MNSVLIFAERMLPSTQTFIEIQVNALKTFCPYYVGLIPAQPAAALKSTPVLLTQDRTMKSRVRREAYRWTGLAPAYHQRLRGLGAKLLHAHFAEGASSAVSISSALEIPMVMHLRGGAELMPDNQLRRRAFQLPFLLWRKRLWRRASAFLCVSNYILRKAAESGFPVSKLRVHYTGIDFTRFRPSSGLEHKDKNLVIYVGRLVEYKGADHLVRAMRIVRGSYPEAYLAFLGDGDFLPAVRKLASQLNVPCQFLGEKPPVEIRTWLDRARVLCVPSLTMPDGMSEAFGNVFTEAQAMGVPVVSYRHGGIPETMLEGKTGLLADEGDHVTLASHILRYLTDETFWSYSRQVGMQWVREHYDVFTQTARLERFYDEVLACSRAYQE
jgi:glycosyltransferase involved in cell wall biosynthesis